MDVNKDVFLVGLLSTPEKRLLCTGVGRVRTKCKRYPGRLHPADVLEQLQRVLPLALFALLSRRINHSVGEYSSKPRLVRCLGHVFHVEVHVDEACRSCSRHFHSPQECSLIAHFASEFFLKGPDLLLQPLLKLEIVCVSPEESHGKMRVSVDEARNQHSSS